MATLTVKRPPPKAKQILRELVKLGFFIQKSPQAFCMFCGKLKSQGTPPHNDGCLALVIIGWCDKHGVKIGGDVTEKSAASGPGPAAPPRRQIPDKLCRAGCATKRGPDLMTICDPCKMSLPPMLWTMYAAFPLPVRRAAAALIEAFLGIDGSLPVNAGEPTIGLSLNTVLYTRDGSRSGNAIVTGTPDTGYCEVTTDLGKSTSMSLALIDELFTIGPVRRDHPRAIKDSDVEKSDDRGPK